MFHSPATEELGQLHTLWYGQDYEVDSEFEPFIMLILELPASEKFHELFSCISLTDSEVTFNTKFIRVKDIR